MESRSPEIPAIVSQYLTAKLESTETVKENSDVFPEIALLKHFCSLSRHEANEFIEQWFDKDSEAYFESAKGRLSNSAATLWYALIRMDVRQINWADIDAAIQVLNSTGSVSPEHLSWHEVAYLYRIFADMKCLITTMKMPVGYQPHYMNLRGADFAGADLSDAILTDLIFDNVDFARAKLDHAVFCRSKFISCSFIEASLIDAKIDWDTFLKSDSDLTTATFIPVHLMLDEMAFKARLSEFEALELNVETGVKLRELLSVAIINHAKTLESDQASRVLKTAKEHAFFCKRPVSGLAVVTDFFDTLFSPSDKPDCLKKLAAAWENVVLASVMAIEEKPKF